MKAVWLLSVSLVIGVGTLPARADTVFGMYAGAGSWLQDYQGEVTSGITSVDVEDDLAIGEEQNNIFYLSLEHPIPVLPNVRLQYAMFKAEERSLLTRTIDFDGAIFPTGSDVETLIDMTQGDAVAYYEVLDGAFSLDFGIATRYVEGEMSLKSSTNETTAEFEAWLPLAYLKTRVNLPLGGFWLGAEAMGAGYDGESLIDANAQVGWESPFGFGLEVGFRTYALDLGEHGDLDAVEVDVSGPYAALNAHF